MDKLLFVDEMRAIEREADASGLSYAQMMENAGVGLAEQIELSYGGGEERSALALVGSGNNGGDALVALVHLANRGWVTRAYLVRARQETDPLLVRFTQAGGQVFDRDSDPLFPVLGGLLRESRVLVDGVLGTGVRLPLSKDVREVLDFVRHFVLGSGGGVRVVAVDCPSGVDCDLGAAAPEAIPADITVTMAAVKVGLMNFPAARIAGMLRVVSIGDLDNINAWRSVQRQIATAEDVRKILPERPANAHKGSFGTALVVSGCRNYTGAALLAGEGAYRSGAGLVTLAVPGSLQPALAGHLPEATWILLPEEAGMIVPSAVERVAQSLGHATALLVGPGLGASDGPRGFVHALLREKGDLLPACVFDADGLRHLAALASWYELLPANTVLTPHPGEMAALTGLPVDEVQSQRVKYAEQFAFTWGHVLVLKGANTVVASPDGRISVIPVATPALARAGTGDVLAGLIVGLRAQGLRAFDAAVAGTWIHAQAGLRAAQDVGCAASVLAGDVLRCVPRVIADFSVKS